MAFPNHLTHCKKINNMWGRELHTRRQLGQLPIITETYGGSHRPCAEVRGRTSPSRLRGAEDHPHNARETRRIGEILPLLMPRECANFFANAGNARA